MNLLTGLFNPYSETILKELEILPGFITGGHHHNSHKIRRCHSAEFRHGKRTTNPLTDGREGERERTKYKLQENRI